MVVLEIPRTDSARLRKSVIGMELMKEQAWCYPAAFYSDAHDINEVTFSALQ